jgi:heat shock protein HtpX
MPHAPCPIQCPMPLTFIDIEKQKTWRIWALLLFLIALYFAVILAFAAPLLPHATHIPARFWIAVFLLALVVAGIHFWFTASNAVVDVIGGLNAQPPDPQDEFHEKFVNIMHEIHTVTGNARNIQSVVIPTLSMNALAAADLNGNAVIAVTEGMLSRLTRSQIEAVVAHEAHHILSGDCLETTVAASLFGTLSSFVEQSAQTTRTGTIHPAFLLAWLMLQLSNLVNMFISREREYRADAAAVRMTRDPIALAETLYLLSRNWRGAGFIGSGYEMLCIVNPEATALDETEGFWADLFSTHPPIQNRIDILLTMAHTNIAGLTVKMKAQATPTPSPAPIDYYAMDPQQQWQGPFAFAELGGLPWLSPLTWIRTGDKQAVARAWKDPLINAIFTDRLKQEQAVSSFSCPSCRQQLVEESYEGTQIYQCRFCAGTLVETVKIPRILARTNMDRPCSERVTALARTTITENQLKFAQRKLRKPNNGPVPLLPCPKCGNPMYRGFYSAAYFIEIDRCTYCGLTWFDRDELEMLQCLIGAAIQ